MKKKSDQIMMLFLTVCAAMLLPWHTALARHQATIVLNNGQRAQGVVRYLPASRSYEITARGATREMPASDVAEVILDEEPEGFSRALRDVEARRYQQAIPVLSRIVEDYAMFGPDRQAGSALILAYIRTDRSSEALRIAETMIRRDSRLERDPAFAAVYWEALLEEERLSTLRTAIREAIQSGPRDLAAVGLLRRGDLQTREGRHREALINGYLRVVLLFRDVGDVQPEALYKAIRAHEKINEVSYAERWRQRLLSNHATSEFAQRLRD